MVGTSTDGSGTRPNPTQRTRSAHRRLLGVAMYRSGGYREVDAFNDEPYADHWFEKVLD